MSKKVNVERFGMQGYGATITEAKRDAESKIEALFSGTWTPFVLSHNGHTLIVYREMNCYGDGYNYMVVRPGDDGQNDRAICSGYESFADAIRSGRRHMAQVVYDPQTGESGLWWIEDINDREGHKSWASWQERYAAWIKSGADHSAAWNKASEGVYPQTQAEKIASDWTLIDTSHD